jgi:hypothetical protein
MMWVAIAGAALKVISAVTGGENEAKAANYNAARLNDQADATLAATRDRESVMRRRNAEGFSAQRTAMLQGGLDPSTGTALLGVEQQMRDAELDALTERYKGLVEARGYRTQAQIERWQGKQKRRQAYVGAVAQLLSSASSYGSMGGGAAAGASGAASSGASAAGSSSNFSGYGGRY